MNQGKVATLHSVGAVGVLRMARAPSNALSSDFCTELHQMIDQALQDDTLQALVLASSLPVFSAGSDVVDILTPAKGGTAALVGLCRLIAGARKPVVAGVGGACLSTGFDLALAARARVGDAKSIFGFPDIRLGLTPAAGGAYRLTRLIGVKVALDMLLTGAAKSPEESLELGLIDRICAPGKAEEEAISLAAELAAAPAGQNTLLQRRSYGANLAEDMAVIAEARRLLPPQSGDWRAQHCLVDLVEGTLLLPEFTALVQQNTVFEDLQRGPVARALSYAFVARQRAQSDKPAAAQPPIAGAETPEIGLRRVMGEVVAYFQTQGLTRTDVFTGLAAFGMGGKQGVALPDCPAVAKDVVPALLAAWANMGAKLLRLGVVRRSDQIDYAALAVGMCPNWRGGPMYLADQRGAMVMRTDLRRRSAQDTSAQAQALFAPDPLWDDLIAKGLRLDGAQAVLSKP